MKAQAKARGCLSRLAEPVAAGETVLRVRRRLGQWDGAGPAPQEVAESRTTAGAPGPVAVRQSELGDGTAAAARRTFERAGMREERRAADAPEPPADEQRLSRETPGPSEATHIATERKFAGAQSTVLDRGRGRGDLPLEGAAGESEISRLEVPVFGSAAAAAEEVRRAAERLERAPGRRFEVVPAPPEQPMSREVIQAEVARIDVERRERQVSERVVTQRAEPSLGLPQNVAPERGGGTTVRIGTVEVRSVMRIPEAAPISVPQPPARMEPAAPAAGSGAVTVNLSRGLGWRYGLVQG